MKDSVNVEALIKENKYFSEAREWYVAKYLKPITEKSWYIILTTITGILFLLYIIATSSFFPLTRSIPFVMYVDDNSNNIHIIRQILSMHGTTHPQLALAEYLVRYYVKSREQYNHQDMAEQTQYIKSNSSRAVYNSFVNYLDTSNNPNSPLLRYKKNGIRSIKITNIEIYGSGSGANNAKVQFTASDNITNIVKEQSVMIRFTLSNIVPSALKLTPLEFRVVAYGK